METLPVEIFQKLLEEIPPEQIVDLCSEFRNNQQWRQTCLSEQFWRIYATKYYPEVIEPVKEYLKGEAGIFYYYLTSFLSHLQEVIMEDNYVTISVTQIDYQSNLLNSTYREIYETIGGNQETPLMLINITRVISGSYYLTFTSYLDDNLATFLQQVYTQQQLLNMIIMLLITSESLGTNQMVISEQLNQLSYFLVDPEILQAEKFHAVS